jgi:uncharacterized membrane protein (UPF0127 family)
MSWWWEFFDEHNMTPYFKSVREISDQMLEAGKGSFEILDVKADIIEAYGLKCGDKLFVYLLNNSNSGVKSKVMIKIAERRSYNVQGFMPAKRTYRKIWNTAAAKEGLLVPAIKLASKESLILILSPKK